MNAQEINSLLTDDLLDNARILHPGEGEKICMEGITCTFKISSKDSNDQLGVYEIALAPRTTGAKLHYHRFMDEIFIVNRGVLTIQLSGKTVDAAAGAVVHIPRFTPHGFANHSDNETVLSLIFNPAQQREGFFHALFNILQEKPVDPDKYLRLYNKYDSYPVDPSNMLPILQ